MTGGQRRLHGYIWILIAVVLPVLIIGAILNAPPGVDDSSASIEPIRAGNALVLERGDIRTAIIETSEGRLLQISLKKPLKHPSALVYTLNKDGQKNRLLGQLHETGNYEFVLEAPIEGILLFDAIKEVEIEKLEFSWD